MDWFVMENPFEMEDLDGFGGTPSFGNTHFLVGNLN